jgi:F420-non-reducing hydrogenase large subunit
VIEEVGIEAGKKVIGIRKELRELEAIVGGKTIHPVCGLPGGISKPLSEEDRKKFIEAADHALEFAFFTLELFNTKVLKNPEYVELIKSDTYTHKTYYMGLVDEQNKVNFYDGDIRVVSPSGEEFIKFEAKDYIKHIAEHVELWSYVKFLYLKGVGWKGFVEGEESGVYSVAPLARLNASDGMATPRAQEAYEKFFETLGKPVHHTLANHWARVVEMVYAAERIGELAKDSEITDPKVRVVCEERPSVGIGVVEAPRGTLFHHYETDERGIIQKANLIVATQNNAARIAMSVETAAKDLIKEGKVDDGILNMVEMAFRAYDPCHACATHTLPGQMPLVVKIYNAEGDLIKQLSR